MHVHTDTTDSTRWDTWTNERIKQTLQRRAEMPTNEIFAERPSYASEPDNVLRLEGNTVMAPVKTNREKPVSCAAASVTTNAKNPRMRTVIKRGLLVAVALAKTIACERKRCMRTYIGAGC